MPGRPSGRTFRNSLQIVQGYVRGLQERRRIADTQGIKTAQVLRQAAAGRAVVKPVVVIHKSLGGSEEVCKSR